MEKTKLLCRNSELMRKLRNLWSSHKKYCTTTIAPYRSYTPLSGYPSSSNYDLDRTYLNSTPHTYRNRFRGANGSIYNGQARDEIGNLSRNLSDLSLDKIDDSDDDPIKDKSTVWQWQASPKLIRYNYGSSIFNMCVIFATKLFACIRVALECVRVTTCVCVFRKELATLQRQVEHLGRSIQTPYSHPPSNFQAPSSHTPTTNRIPHSQPDSGPVYTGTEPPRDPAFRPDPRLDTNLHSDHETSGDVIQDHIQEQPSDLTANYNIGAPHDQPINTQEYNEPEEHTISKQDYHNQDIKSQRKLSKQNSRESSGKDEKIIHKQLSKDNITPQQKMETDDSEPLESNVVSQDYNTGVNREKEVIDQTKVDDTKGMDQDQLEYVADNIPVEGETQQYDNQQYSPEEYQNYEQNYEPPQQNYEQTQPNFEQPQQYTEQYENYEQYPQQYADPNAQYGEQYEDNYPTDGNYTEQAYDNTQYNQEYTEEQQYSENVEQTAESNENVEASETPQDLQKNSTPKEKLASQS
ncbi:jg3577 [Pararge aegeria aegeria]|uniref:Jg3577 protein n=1 Tax=Pararge aegeria aegeria TaxID=348720 RepID=A0A8S4S6F1_9NEOP|nr:jg3577 [Pararge aegeria aegeria]